MSDDIVNDPEDFFRKMFQLPSREEVQRQHMQATAEVHEIYAWFNEASLSDLKKIKAITNSILSMSNADPAGLQAGFWQGFLTAKLNDFHNICPGCGINHMDELLPPDEDNRVHETL